MSTRESKKDIVVQGGVVYSYDVNTTPSTNPAVNITLTSEKPTTKKPLISDDAVPSEAITKKANLMKAAETVEKTAQNVKKNIPKKLTPNKVKQAVKKVARIGGAGIVLGNASKKNLNIDKTLSKLGIDAKKIRNNISNTTQSPMSQAINSLSDNLDVIPMAEAMQTLGMANVIDNQQEGLFSNTPSTIAQLIENSGYPVDEPDLDIDNFEQNQAQENDLGTTPINRPAQYDSPMLSAVENMVPVTPQQPTLLLPPNLGDMSTATSIEDNIISWFQKKQEKEAKKRFIKEEILGIHQPQLLNTDRSKTQLFSSNKTKHVQILSRNKKRNDLLSGFKSKKVKNLLKPKKNKKVRL